MKTLTVKILIVVAVLAIGTGVYFASYKSEFSSEQTINWNTYNNELYKLTFSYPKEWVSQSKSGLPKGDVFVSFREANTYTQSYAVYFAVGHGPSLLDGAKDIQDILVDGIQMRSGTTVNQLGSEYRVEFFKEGYRFQFLGIGMEDGGKTVRTMAKSITFF